MPVNSPLTEGVSPTCRFPRFKQHWRLIRHLDQKLGRNIVRALGVSGIPAAALLVVLLTTISARSDPVRHGVIAVTCTNPASGAIWQIKIDYDLSTVDSNPAKITETKISWRNAADGGNYTLDRKTGELTVIIASSTGGFFLHDRCQLEN